MLNFIVQYYLPPDATQTRKVVVENCENIHQAIQKFTEQYGEEAAGYIVSVTPTNISL